MEIYEHDQRRFASVLERLRTDANARFVFLLDTAGQHIASAGEMGEIDPTALASLAAGNVAATEGVAQLVGEERFTSIYHEGPKESIHINGVAGQIVLLVAFDHRSSLGLVRLRVGQHGPELKEIVDEVVARAADPAAKTRLAAEAGFAEMTDEDIDALFG